LRERLELLDWREQHELMRIYDEHGIFLFPSLFEGFSKALIEAMTRGLCVVASDVSGARDIIDDGVDGFLCAPQDSIGMVARIELLLGDPLLAASVSRAAALNAAAFTWDTVAQSSVDFFRRILDSRYAAQAPVYASS
jgi:glycosyltransferase involved in cell wall biosynthesis